MDMPDQSSRDMTYVSALAEIEAVIERARSGELKADAAVAAIGRITERRQAGSPAEIYQKPWG
jgi:hypothetical protein